MKINYCTFQTALVPQYSKHKKMTAESPPIIETNLHPNPSQIDSQAPNVDVIDLSISKPEPIQLPNILNQSEPIEVTKHVVMYQELPIFLYLRMPILHQSLQ